MPSIEENIKAWGNNNRWSQELEQGDKWSRLWGSVNMQWYGSILPRIQKYLSNNNNNHLGVGTVLEIAPGYGRWTQYLQALCQKIIVVDLSPNCIEACKERFSKLNHLEYHINDGKDLSMIPDDSIDFVFSHDSLVHAEADVIESYLAQLSLKLKINGVGFIHHSNLGNYLEEVEKEAITPHWRAKSVTAAKFKEIAEKYQLLCISQELFNWGNKQGKNTDCFSVFTKNVSPKWLSSKYQLIESDFMTEAKYLKNLAQIY